MKVRGDEYDLSQVTVRRSCRNTIAGTIYIMVRTVAEYRLLCRWMRDNNVEYLQEYSGPDGIGFSIRSNLEWFSLRWL